MGALAFFSARPGGRTAGSTVIFRAFLVAVTGFSWCAPTAADSVYRWVDADGVTHISSARPPGSIKAERIDLGSTGSSARRTAAANNPRSAGVAVQLTTPQTAQREAVLANLRERECVYAIESLDRMTSGATKSTPAELKRVQQTVALNCSDQAQRRTEQEAKAAKLRVANGSVCLDARNQLAAMLEPGQRPQREQLKVQQEFIEAHCVAPVR